MKWPVFLLLPLLVALVGAAPVGAKLCGDDVGGVLSRTRHRRALQRAVERLDQRRHAIIDAVDATHVIRDPLVGKECAQGERLAAILDVDDGLAMMLRALLGVAQPGEQPADQLIQPAQAGPAGRPDPRGIQ